MNVCVDIWNVDLIRHSFFCVLLCLCVCVSVNCVLVWIVYVEKYSQGFLWSKTFYKKTFIDREIFLCNENIIK